MAVRPFEFDDFCKWIQREVEYHNTSVEIEILYRTICKHMTTENFIRMVKGYIRLTGGKEIEFNSSYTKIRIYGRKAFTKNEISK